MKIFPLSVVLLGFASVSCDKAKNLANQARTAVEGELAKNSTETENTTPDPELVKLVDQTPEGYIFRKDLPFPSRLDVVVTRVQQSSVRTFETSEIGSTPKVVKGTQKTVSHVERVGDQVRYTLQESTFADPVPEGQDKPEKPVVRQLAPASKPRIFKKTESKWITETNGDFRSAVLSQQLSPVFDQLLEESAVAPRQMWLGKHRVKVGTTIPVTGDMLPMLLTGRAKGSLNLKLDSIGAVNGHPCGMFSISGDYSRKQFTDFEGNVTDEDVTIESGKIWLSLLYPVILREELETVQTFRSGSQGNAALRGQGAISVSVMRQWKKTTP